MNCPKHPKEKMTLLLFSYVCDICDPPKGAKPAEPKTFHGAKATFSIGDVKIIPFDPEKVTCAARNDSDDFLLCRVCNERIIQATLINYQVNHEADVMCLNGHREYETLLHGDRIYSLHGGHAVYDANFMKWV